MPWSFLCLNLSLCLYLYLYCISTDWLWGSQEVWTVFVTFIFSHVHLFSHQVHIIALPLLLAGSFKPPAAPHRHLRPLETLPHWRGPLIQRWLVSLLVDQNLSSGGPLYFHCCIVKTCWPFNSLPAGGFVRKVTVGTKDKSHISWLEKFPVFGRALLSIAISRGNHKVGLGCLLLDRYR